MKKVVKLVTIFLMILPLASCWDSKGLEDLLLVYGLGIDVSQDNPDQYLFTIGFPTIIEEAPQKKNEYFTEAPSLGHGKDNLQKKVYREISYDNIKVVVFGEDAAKKGIFQHVDSMFREPLFRGTTRLAVVKDRAVDLLGLEPPVSLLVSNFIFESIQQNYEDTTVPRSTLRNFSHEYYTPGIEPAMPFICYGANRQELNIGCIALFNQDKMIHQLKGDNSRAFMILRNQIHTGVYSFDCDGSHGFKADKVSIILKGGSSKINTRLTDSGLSISQDVDIQCSLAQYNADEIIFTDEKLKSLETFFVEEITKDLKETVEILQKQLKSDNVGYGKVVRANHPEFFDAQNWNEQFSQVPIDINVKVNIKTVGIIP